MNKTPYKVIAYVTNSVGLRSSQAATGTGPTVCRGGLESHDFAQVTCPFSGNDLWTHETQIYFFQVVYFFYPTFQFGFPLH